MRPSKTRRTGGLRKDMQDRAGETEYPRKLGRVPPSTAKSRWDRNSLAAMRVRREAWRVDLCSPACAVWLTRGISSAGDPLDFARGRPFAEPDKAATLRMAMRLSN